MAGDVYAKHGDGFVSSPQLVECDRLGIGVAWFFWPQSNGLSKWPKRFDGTSLPSNCQRQRVLRFR
jgi:hypothetical protein